MALADILEKIKKEAEKKVSELEKDFEERKKKLEEDNEKKQKEIDEHLHKKIEGKSAKILEKAETLAEMESKNQLLKAKRKIIEEALEKAIETLAQSKDYEKHITQMLKTANLESEEIVVVPARGKEEETKKAIKESGKKYFLSDKSADIAGGFILKTSKIEIDNSFETIVKKQLREDLEISLNKLLFA